MSVTVSAPARGAMEHDLERAIYPLEDLEIRQGRTISGSFPYGSTATRRSSGRVRKERIQPRAFRYAVDGEGRDRPLDLLTGHDFGKPLASRDAGSLVVTDTPSALSFVATLPPPELQPTHVRDAVLMLEAGPNPRDQSWGFKCQRVGVSSGWNPNPATRASPSE